MVNPLEVWIAAMVINVMVNQRGEVYAATVAVLTAVGVTIGTVITRALLD